MSVPQSALTRAMGARRRSIGLDAQWSDMTRADIWQWLSDHGDEGELLHRELMSALLKFGVWIRDTKAHDARGAFDVEAYLNDALDSACAPLAPEVKEWLGS